MSGLLKTLGIIVIVFSVFVGYKHIVDKRATIKEPVSHQAILAPGDYTRNLTAWPKRPYDIHVPLGYNASRPTAVVLVLHGGGGNSKNAAKLTCPAGNVNSPKCFNALADKERFVVVYPNGTARPLLPNIRTWNAGGGGRGYLCVGEYACEHKIDDVTYFRDLLSELSEIINIERTRVYAAGISNGGAMSHRLACELSDWIVAIAAVGGGNQFSAVAPCHPPEPVSVLQIHGTDDPAWPYHGGPGIREGGNFYGAPDTVSGWVARNTCSSEPIKENMADAVNDGTRSTKESYGNCRKHKNREVSFIIVRGGGHTWPQGSQYLPEVFVGKTSQDFSANETIWQFFKEHSRR